VASSSDENMYLATGATFILTPALLWRLGRDGVELAGVRVFSTAQPAKAAEAMWNGSSVALAAPLDVEREIRERGATVLLRARVDASQVPLVTLRSIDKGRVMVWNLRTFSETDFQKVGEMLLAPQPLALSEIPEALANQLRRLALNPLGVALESPAGVVYYMLSGAHCLYNFQDRELDVVLHGNKVKLVANGLLWK
jgi:hypothetical protein